MCMLSFFFKQTFADFTQFNFPINLNEQNEQKTDTKKDPKTKQLEDINISATG